MPSLPKMVFRLVGWVSVVVLGQAALPVVPATAELGVVTTIPVEACPTGIALRSDGTRLYVVNANPFASPRRGSISVIDTLTNTVTATIPLLDTGSTEQIALTPDGSRAYVATDNKVQVVDLASLTLLPSIVTSNHSLDASDIAISPDGRRGYVTHRTSDTVVVIDTDPQSPTFHTVLSTISVGPFNTTQPYGIAITPDGARVYVASGPTRTVSVIATATNTVVATIPIAIAGVDAGQGAAISPNGTRAYVVFGSHIAILDIDPSSATYNQHVDTITPGASSLGDVAVSSDGGSLLATSSATNALLVIDARPESATFKSVVHSVPVSNAVGIAYRGLPKAFAYVTSGRCDMPPGNVAVVAELVLSVLIDIKPGSFPNSINLSAAGVIPVAILSSATFDATQVSPASVTLAGARVNLIGKSDKYACSPEDVNADGLPDLVCHVTTAQFMIEPGDSIAVLEAETFSGQRIRGEDSIQIVPD